MIGLYVPGDSLLHRTRAGVKLAGLLTALALVTAFASVPVVLGALAATIGLGRLSGLGWSVLGRQARPVAWVLVLVGAAQVWLAGTAAAVVVCGSILLAVLAAGLVTLTTRTEDLIEALVRALAPLRHVGIRPERVALLLALVIRTVPVLARIATEVREARAARGAQRSVRGYAVPMVIRTVRHADRMGEALIARGVDD